MQRAKINATACFRCRALMPISVPVIENAACIVNNNRIIELGSHGDIAPHWTGPMTDLGEVLVLPGMVNSHCHLDYGMMRGVIPRQKSFTRWIQKINAAKREIDAGQYLTAIRDGMREAHRLGTALMLNIESFPELMPALASSPMKICWAVELMNIRQGLNGSEMLGDQLTSLSELDCATGGIAVSPHAPYTASPELYRQAGEFSRKHKLPFTTHLSESVDEMEMFTLRDGPMFHLLASLGRDMSDCDGMSRFQYLLEADALPRNSILVHMNGLPEIDLALLEKFQPEKNFSVVHCPQSHAYFRHPPFPYRQLKQLGINTCLGTDSLASGNSLSMFEEMRRFQSANPEISPEEILELATIHGARALGMEKISGNIRCGADASLITLPYMGNVKNAAETAIHFTGMPEWLHSPVAIR